MPRSVSPLGRRAAPYRLQIGTPVATSRLFGMSVSAVPPSPCSGVKIAASRTPGALQSRSMLRRPRASTPV